MLGLGGFELVLALVRLIVLVGFAAGLRGWFRVG